MKNSLFLLVFLLILNSCVSTKSTLQNVDDHAPLPKLTSENTFLLTTYSTDKKYGYNQDYPINVYYRDVASAVKNEERFLNALAGPKGEKITYTKTGICCPFPNKRTEMGVASLDVYVIRWEGQKSQVTLYLNAYEKGALMIPVGLTSKNNPKP